MTDTKKLSSKHLSLKAPLIREAKIIFSCVNNVVKNSDIKHLCRLVNLLCNSLVFSTWFDIATRMVVSENHRYSISK